MTGDTKNDGTNAELGLVCRHCGCRHFRVFYVRRRAGYIRRVRICRYCGQKLITSERVS